MAQTFTDMPLELLREYRPELVEPDGLDAFGTDTLGAARAAARPATLTPVDGPVRALSIQDPRERPADKQQQADEKHARFTDKESDFFTLLRRDLT